MNARLAHLWAHHKFLFLSFALALTITLFFILRTTIFFIYWYDPAHRNQPLEPWMTPHYIGHSYDLPPEKVLRMLDHSKGKRRRPTLDWIARTQNIPVKTLIQDLTQKLENQ